MDNNYTLVSDAIPPKQKLIKNQVALLEKSTKKFGDIPKIFGAFKDKIGIEVEVENCTKAPEDSIYWVTVPDGSLKNMGAEFVSCPIGGHNIDYALHELKTFLQKEQIDWSHRTSIHVHVGIGELSVRQLQAFLCTYATLEKLFFSFVADHRRGNPYCYYLTDTNPDHIAFGDASLKYCALNVGNSVAQFNTVEFRHMQGTEDFRLIRRWLMLIIKLVRFIKREDANKVIARILNLNSDSTYYEFVKDIYDTSFRFFIGMDFQKEMEEGVLWAKAFLVRDEL